MHDPSLFLLLSTAQQLRAIPHHAYHGARLHHLASAAAEPILNLREAIEPSHHDRGGDIQLGQFVAQRRDDVGEREALRGFQGIDHGEAGRDVGRLQERVQDLADVVGVRRCDTFVDSRRRD